MAPSGSDDVTINGRFAEMLRAWRAQLDASPDALDLHRRFGLSEQQAEQAHAEDLADLERAAAAVEARPGVAVGPRDWSRMKLAGGRFEIDGRPVFPLGFSWIDEPEFARYHEGGPPGRFADTLGPLVDDMRPLGVGLYEVNVRISSLATADPEQGRRTAGWLRERLDLYHERGAAANVLFIWARTADLGDRYPGLTDQQVAFFRLDPDHPDFRAVAGEAIDNLMREVGGHPALKAVCLANEPDFGLESWTDHTLVRFRRWLADRYGGVESLNERWGTAFTDLDAIDGPGHRGEVGEARWYDTITFHEERITETFAFLADRVRSAGGGDVPLHIKIQDISVVGTRPVDATNGLDREALAQLTDLHGIDTRLLPTADPRLAAPGWDGDRYALHWLPATLTYDLLHSFVPGQGIFDTELHAFSTSALRFPDTPLGHARAAAWLPAMFGSTGNITWYWQRREALGTRHLALSHAYHASLTTQPELLFEYLAANARLNDHAPLVVRAAAPQRPVGIVFSRTSRLHDVAHVHALHAAYEAVAFSGHGVRFLTERQLAAGAADEVAVVIEPAVSHLPADAADALAALPAAKRVVVAAPAEVRDPWGEPLAHDRPDPTPTADLAAAVGRRLPAPLVSLVGPDRRTLVRSAATPEGGVALLFHVGVEPAEVRLAGPPGWRPFDVLADRPLDAGPVRLEPFDVRLITWR